MEFAPPLEEGRLLRRYKRFLADVELADGSSLTLHCPNTGAMTGCNHPDSRVWFSRSANPKRKYPCTWELVETAPGVLACVNTGRANALAQEAIEQGMIEPLAGYSTVQREVRYGAENSRIDLLLDGEQGRCYVEVKNVTLGLADGLGLFPDAVSARGTKHLRELMAVRRDGHRAVLLFCVAHTGIQQVQPADQIDPRYGETLREALAAGVEVLAYQAEISPRRMALVRRLPVHCP